MRSCLCGHEKFRLIDGGKIECEQCGIRDHLTNVFEVVAEAERELPADSARLINERLTRARDDIYRAAQELEVSDPSYRRLWEFARMVEDEKIALLRRCKECP